MCFGSYRLRTWILVAMVGITSSMTAHAQTAMDDAWQVVLRRWVGEGWRIFKDIDAGFTFQTAGFQPNTSGGKRWGAGLQAGVPVLFAAVCSDCRGVQLILRDGDGNIVAFANPQQGSTSLIYTPTASSKGSIDLIPVGCQKPACAVRYASFGKR